MIVAAEATGDVAIVGLQFTIDGVNIGDEITSAPYEVQGDTAASASWRVAPNNPPDHLLLIVDNIGPPPSSVVPLTGKAASIAPASSIRREVR